MNPNEITVEVSVRIGHKEIRQAVNIDESVARALRPLPRDREIDPMSAGYARKQQSERSQTCRMIAQSLAGSILKAIESRDPVNGYSPEENQRFHEPTKSIPCSSCKINGAHGELRRSMSMQAHYVHCSQCSEMTDYFREPTKAVIAWEEKNANPGGESQPDYVDLLKSLLVSEKGKTVEEANRLVSAHPDLVTKGIIGGNFTLRATAMALEMAESES